MDNRDSFDKFTEQARKVLSLAQEEAQSFQHNYIGTEHLLLGLVHEGEGVAAHVLESLGIKLPKVRQAVVFIISRSDRIVAGEIGLTPRAKKVIELAVDEARRMNHHYIGTEHILLGLVREGEGIAAGVLESLGAKLEDIRTQTIRVLELTQKPHASSIQQASPQSPSSHTNLRFAGQLSKRETQPGSNFRRVRLVPLNVNQYRKTQEAVKDADSATGSSPASSQPSLPVAQSQPSTRQSQPVLPRHVFVAYSRRDFYFTESLFYALHSSGIYAWMDAWMITPGNNWEDDIRQALASSEGMVLVATKESLRSPYVKDEICQAYRANKSVYLLIRGHITRKDLHIEHEYVEQEVPGKVPTREKMSIDLYDYAQVFIDMRAGFRKGVIKLADAISNQKTYRKRLPGPLNRKTEPILAIVWITLFLILLMAFTEVWKYGSGTIVADLLNQVMGYIRDILHGKVGEILFLVPAAIAHYITLFVEITLALFTFKFIRRKEVQASDFFNVMLRDVLGLGIIILLQDYFSMYENIAFFSAANDLLAQSASALPFDEGVFLLSCFHLILYLLIIILLIVFCVMYNMRDGRGAILRWLPTGKASQTIRQKGNAQWISKLPNIRVSRPPEYRSYYIDASKEDRAIANDIRAMLHRRGYKTTERRKDAQCDLILLSPFADDSPLKQADQHKNSRPIIYVLARSIKPSKGTLTRIQWIDYRRPVEDQFWKQWVRHFEQLKKDKHPVFPYVPENQLKSLISTKHGNGILLMILAVGWGSAWLLSLLEYLMFMGNISHTVVPPLSSACLLLAIGINYLTIIQMLRGTTSLRSVRRRLIITGLMSILAAWIAHNGSLFVNGLLVFFINLLVANIARKNILAWIPLSAKRINKRSLLQPITYYKALTSREHLFAVIAGLLVLNTLVVNGSIIPTITRESPMTPYAVTVPGPYSLASPGLWSQDPFANALGFHFTYQSDRLEVSQDHSTTGGQSWIEFLGTNGYPRQFAPHFRSSIHVQFTSNDPRTAVNMIFDDTSSQQFTLLAAGFWQVHGSGTPGYAGRLVGQEQAPGYTLEVEVNGILCTYKINGQTVATVANTAISSINNILFTVDNFNPNGTRLYLSHFTYTSLAGPALSRSAASQLVNAHNSAPYTALAPGWNCNPTVERWSPFIEPTHPNAALTCTPTGTRLNQANVFFLDFDNGGFGGLPDAFTYSFQATLQGASADQCFFAGINTTEDGGIHFYLYEFSICANGTWATKRIGYSLAPLGVFQGQQFALGHFHKQKTVALRIAFHSMTQDLYINNQLVTSYTASAPQSALLSLLFGNDNGPVIFSHFSFVPETK